MKTRQGIPSLLTGLTLMLLVIVVSGCGSAGTQAGGQGNTPTQPSGNTDSQPQKVEIEIDNVNDQQGKPIVTVTNSEIVQQLYTTISGLPQMPKEIACTMELGPAYNLVFHAGNKIVMTAKAEKYGCRPVRIKGETQERQATKEFWPLLDKAIYTGTPPTKVQWLSIMQAVQPQHPTQTTRITSSEQAQRLYDAIVKLPEIPQNKKYSCSSQDAPEYQMVFHPADHLIVSDFNKKCGYVTLGANYESRSGTYQVNEQFTKLFEETLAAAPLTQGQPDQLSIATNKDSSDTQSIRNVSNLVLAQKLYKKIFTLPQTKPQPNCPSEDDKVARKGTHYDLRFTQWDLPVLTLSAYEGSCKQIIFNHLSSERKVLQGDQEFWSLLHQGVEEK
jgi:hypothetical protein